MAERVGGPVSATQRVVRPVRDPLRGFPVLAEVPRAASWQAANELIQNPNSPYSLAVIGLAQRALSPVRGARPKIVTITAAQAGELKSALAVNFARAAARMGQRVLIIDGNLTSPLATRLMGLKPPRNGVAEVVSGAAPLSQSLLRDPGSSAFVLSPATRPPYPAQVLASPRIPELLNHLRYSADLIVIDAPALSQEQAILASLSDAVLFVTPADQSSDAVGFGLDALAGMRAPAVGIVVAH
jgi:tyrosine-protein kinase Etk/Wzc